MSYFMQVDAYEVPVSKETVAGPTVSKEIVAGTAVEQATADCSVPKSMTPLLFGSDVVENNKNWFQSRSG